MITAPEPAGAEHRGRLPRGVSSHADATGQVAAFPFSPAFGRHSVNDQNSSPASSSSSDTPFISVRSALVALIGVFAGCVIGGLTCLAVPNVPAAVIAGIATAGVCIREAHKLIG